MRRRLLLRNLKQMLPYVNSNEAIDAPLIESLQRSIRGGGDAGASLDDLFRANAQRSRTQVAACLFVQFHRGKVAAELELSPLTTDTRWLPT
ncbi:hypothetical protein [Dyella sp. AD56]|uniref:hypothetical protein n=1 Tax=Dyella sp. AD56 TaxID=1528744 RepID=UPI0011AECBA5|nr:hypothetical protein [Dyella sp. AD56]